LREKDRQQYGGDVTKGRKQQYQCPTYRAQSQPTV
jgi:hypothetical protein